MIPVVTPARMAEIDAAAPEPVDVLIERAGAAVARAAVEMMGGTYGRRVAVLAGPGNNGADGRAAARRLRRRGARIRVFSATDVPEELPAADLYIDAAFGTGLSRPYTPPRRGRGDAPVLAVDIPSGLDGLTGESLGGPVWPARRTVTFAALKPGLLFGDGPAACGSTTVADIGLAVSADDLDACALMTDADIESLPAGTGATHKWHSAALVVAGSPGMGGAAALACEAAVRSGARMIHLSTTAEAGMVSFIEAVRSEPPLAVDADRFAVCAAGPGLGTGEQAAKRLADALALDLPTVIDADGLRLLHDPAVAAAMDQRRSRSVPVVLTPHDAELEAVTGSRPGPDRIAVARAAAAQTQAVVLLKGGPTVVADSHGRVRIVSSGDARLASAGTGDVLTGMIAGRLAAFGPERLLDRVAEAAHLHGKAAAAAAGEAARLLASELLGALRTVTP
ncbi:MAG: NAD(P)H-hydrate dehydratase [Acidimicrobiaceae bacterium]|nr:NAD(P)H-hydrate dehydratase [Acidimicrobiaceae bacterium]MXZ66793.1 NAD(P)H-hydrate dehydratase [Acidimicrobiaceae bacterium]MYF32897.1 NAD(P)H-hydrate dehydratase [Acidimicrobiaceae bacterium]MYG77883.1 NAD(P)H-hydrate dehydratase [Acidimicrobiaceae bacterium]MYJ28915.1 NAD(P)H-hydrate dehydratase [Acidimicrobiaceae bacterium]